MCPPPVNQEPSWEKLPRKLVEMALRLRGHVQCATVSSDSNTMLAHTTCPRKYLISMNNLTTTREMLRFAESTAGCIFLGKKNLRTSEWRHRVKTFNMVIPIRKNIHQNHEREKCIVSLEKQFRRQRIGDPTDNR